MAVTDPANGQSSYPTHLVANQPPPRVGVNEFDVTITGNGLPRRGNDFLFGTIAKAADAYAQSGHLLHWTDFFQGDPASVKRQDKIRK